MHKRDERPLEPELVAFLKANRADHSPKGRRGHCFPPKPPRGRGESLWEGNELPPSGLLKHCNIPVEPATLSVKRFHDEYYAKGRAVIIRNLTQGAWPAHERWRTAASLRAAYGDALFFVGTRAPQMARTMNSGVKWAYCVQRTSEA